MPPSSIQMRRPHVLIVGAGFAGLTAARTLGNTEVDVTVVDRTNHHLFQPLLYQVATATLAPTEVTAPIRWLLGRYTNTTVLLDTVTEIDIAHRIVRLADDPRELTYDYLILATGARHSYFSHPEWEPLAPGLKGIGDALEIRRRFLLAFEEAERTTNAAEREALLTFVVIGGGPTGVELAGMLPTIAQRGLRGEFRHIDPMRTRVILLEGGPRLLPAFIEPVSESARTALMELGVDVRTNAVVTQIDNDAVYVGAERIATRNAFWAAGNTASPLGRHLHVPRDSIGRVIVERDLSIPDHPDVFVVGDLALVPSDGAPVPAVAPAAIQQGRAAARNVLHTVRRQARKPFRYWNKGNLATIGRSRAVAQFGTLYFSGRPAWWLWLFVHIMYLAGFRNRLAVLFEWAYAYLTDQRGARLVSDASPPHYLSGDGSK